MSRLALDIFIALGEAKLVLATAPPDSREHRLAASVAPDLAAIHSKLRAWERAEPPEPPPTEVSPARV